MQAAQESFLQNAILLHAAQMPRRLLRVAHPRRHAGKPVAAQLLKHRLDMKDTDPQRKSKVKVAKRVLYVLTLLAVAASLLPLLETEAWWIRALDFPRLQLGIISLLTLAVLAALFERRSVADYTAATALLAAVVCHAWKLAPYTEMHADLALQVADCPPDSQLTVLSANVQMSSHSADHLLRIVREADPDLFLALETNERWDLELSVLTNRMPFTVQHVNSNYFGIHLFSRLPLLNPVVRFFSNDEIPAILSGVRLPNGGEVRFIGLHPRPPRVGETLAHRDAQLMSAALAAREAAPPVILAGDLNAAPWEPVMRRLLRLGALLDPRIGRGYFATFRATSWLESWPLDYVLFQDRIALRKFEVLPAFGSDHYPVLSVLCIRPDAAALQSAPRSTPHDLEAAAAVIRRGRAPQPDSEH